METSTVAAVARTVDLEELSKHTTEKDCYLLYNGKVYDVTEFLDEHPGGKTGHLVPHNQSQLK